MRWRERSWLVLVFVLTGPISAACSAEFLTLATTTSTENTGLLACCTRISSGSGYPSQGRRERHRSQPATGTRWQCRCCARPRPRARRRVPGRGHGTMRRDADVQRFRDPWTRHRPGPHSRSERSGWRPFAGSPPPVSLSSLAAIIRDPSPRAAILETNRSIVADDPGNRIRRTARKPRFRSTARPETGIIQSAREWERPSAWQAKSGVYPGRPQHVLRVCPRDATPHGPADPRGRTPDLLNRYGVIAVTRSGIPK